MCSWTKIVDYVTSADSTITCYIRYFITFSNVKTISSRNFSNFFIHCTGTYRHPLLESSSGTLYWKEHFPEEFALLEKAFCRRDWNKRVFCKLIPQQFHFVDCEVDCNNVNCCIGKICMYTVHIQMRSPKLCFSLRIQ